MQRYGRHTGRLLEQLHGGRADSRQRRIVERLPQFVAPTLRLVEDPLQEVEDSIMDLGELEGVSVQQRLHDPAHRGVGYDGAGRLVLAGRRCCYEMAMGLNTRIDTLPVPSDYVCIECGRRWRLETAVREERVHGR